MFSIDQFYRTYETETAEVVINGKKFHMLLPRYLYRFIDPINVLHDFPLWAKIWKASWVLSAYLADLSPDANKRLLEIGAGAGLVSIVAANFGHQITMTEYNPDALNFARANAFLNNCPDLPIEKLDWNLSRPAHQYDMIVAAEVTYKKDNFIPLTRFFKSHLKPGGEIILASEIRKSGTDIFGLFKSDFDITVLKKTLRSETVAIPVVLLKMRSKVEAVTR
jgi:2-polyprenyl-3-methyl-5-hydroxy-6-metoxy-1,4-benzoquinol methylase